MGLGKRGQDVTLGWTIFHLLILAFFVLFTSAMVFSIAQGTKVEQSFEARKIALLINALETAPGGIQYSTSLRNVLIYTLKDIEKGKVSNVVQFYYELKDGQVRVHEKDQEGGSFYPYLKDNYYIEEAKPSNKFIFRSFGNEFAFEEDAQARFFGYQFKFPLVETRSLARDIKVETEAGLNRQEEIALETLLPGWSNYKTVDYDIYVYVEFAGTEVKAYIPPDKALKSRKLASLIVNNMMEDNPNKDFNAVIGLNDQNENLNQAKEAGVLLYLPMELAKQDSLRRAINTYFE